MNFLTIPAACPLTHFQQRRDTDFAPMIPPDNILSNNPQSFNYSFYILNIMTTKEKIKNLHSLLIERVSEGQTAVL